jgi:hypothetical protein
MARLVSFRTQVAESLEKGDAMKFREVFTSRLLESYNSQQRGLVRQLIEQEDPEMKIVTAIQAAAKSFGGHGFIYDRGLLGVLVPVGESASGFANYLDGCDDVSSYDEDEVSTPVTSESPTDLEGGEGRNEIHFSIELNPESVVEFTGHMDLEEAKKCVKEEDDEDEDDMEDEEDEEDEEDDEDEELDEEEDMDEEDEDLDETTHPGLMKKFNAFVNSVTPLHEVSKIVTFRHVGQSNDIKKQLKLPPRPGFKIVDGGYVRLSAQAKKNMAKGQIAGARKRALTQVKALKRREASLKKRTAAGF